MKKFPNRKVFEEQHNGDTDGQILREILYDLKVNIHKNELIRSNTSKLVFWFVTIPLIIFLFTVFLFLIGIAQF
ncbi:hypothetical protein [Spongiivirga citrea]|uniref:Uncharacterized protein n=1 Tax=Spongiivirga citrea TaxID=1481457 RepID=A0A6M0CMG3_9FLAO|nr:hypothetical protein [Spongiivirga citrea]NER17019.1 hypothetical protein [Spongiivirga citrea]